MGAETDSVVEVAVGVLLDPNGCVLLAKRPMGKVYDGFWEFPGGKVEPGESPRQALDRELAEELGIEVLTAYPWITQLFTYPHARVRLNFFRVTAWRGQPRPVEHADMSWQRPESVGVAPLLPANGPVLRGLALPAEYALTQCREMGMEAQLSALNTRLRMGLRLIQVREPGMTGTTFREFLGQVLVMAHAFGAKVLVSSDSDLARTAGADGVHLPAQELLRCAVRPDFPLVAASCHDAVELRAAEALNVDFAVLGSVLQTPSHPDVVPLGWSRFATLAGGASIPVFALGGISSADINLAWAHGAHGIAMQRGAWVTR